MPGLPAGEERLQSSTDLLLAPHTAQAALDSFRSPKRWKPSLNKPMKTAVWYGGKTFPAVRESSRNRTSAGLCTQPWGGIHALGVPGLCPLCSAYASSCLCVVVVVQLGSMLHSSDFMGKGRFVKSINGGRAGGGRGREKRGRAHGQSEGPLVWAFPNLEGSAPLVSPLAWSLPPWAKPHSKCTLHRGGRGLCPREGVGPHVLDALQATAGTTP